MNQSNVSHEATKTTPTIISVAESTHYLVGEKDRNNRFQGINNSNDIKLVSSLADAKQYLKNHKISTACLEFQTAYDEMCGTATSENVQETIHF